MSFNDFRQECSQRQRYIRSEESEQFLRGVAATCEARSAEIASGRTFWRAQLDHAWRHEELIGEEVPFPCDIGRMSPWPDKAVEGRANAKGIPCLYVATTRDAALSEMRPWIGSLVSVATFETQRKLKVVDCSKHVGNMNFLNFLSEEPSPEQMVEAVWAEINRSFARPVTRSDNTAEYAATQTLAELFRNEGYDGVAYKSAFGDDGFNLALFNTSSAHLTHCFLYETKSVKFEFSDTGERYAAKTRQI